MRYHVPGEASECVDWILCRENLLPGRPAAAGAQEALLEGDLVQRGLLEARSGLRHLATEVWDVAGGVQQRYRERVPAVEGAAGGILTAPWRRRLLWRDVVEHCGSAGSSCARAEGSRDVDGQGDGALPSISEEPDQWQPAGESTASCAHKTVNTIACERLKFS